MKEYACIAKIRGGARCRNLLGEGRTLCPIHERMSKEGELVVAPMPERVVVKFRINLNLADELRNMGVRYEKIDWEKKEEIHIEQAKKYCREPYVLRGKDKSADAGVPVFGKDGLSNVSLASIWKEFEREHYKMVNVYLSCPRGEKSNKNKMRILWITFLLSGRGNKISSFFINASVKKQISNLFLYTYQFCHVWANPPDLNNVVTHTVNLAHILDISPKLTLFFKQGLWEVKAAI